MKKQFFLMVFILIAQISIFTSQAKANGLSDPEEIISAKPMSFTTNTNENWYFFTLGYDTNVAIFGSDVSGAPIYQINIYDENMTEVFAGSDLNSASVRLNTGRYFVNISETQIGTFSVYSKYLEGPPYTDPVKGSMTNPYLPENGVALPFLTETTTNIYYFEMMTYGNFLMSGSDSSSNAIYQINIYDENMLQVFSDRYVDSTAKTLPAGKYYLMVSETETGSITLYSPSIGETPVLPDYLTYQDGLNDGQICTDNPDSCGSTVYQNGFNDGSQSCIDDPSSCGISSYEEGQQACIDDPSSCGIATYEEGQQACIDDPSSCGISSYEEGQQACINDPSSCGIATYEEGQQACIDDPNSCGIKPTVVVISL